jgi:hypothetical protein
VAAIVAAALAPRPGGPAGGGTALDVLHDPATGKLVVVVADEAAVAGRGAAPAALLAVDQAGALARVTGVAVTAATGPAAYCDRYFSPWNGCVWGGGGVEERRGGRKGRRVRPARGQVLRALAPPSPCLHHHHQHHRHHHPSTHPPTHSTAPTPLGTQRTLLPLLPPPPESPRTPSTAPARRSWGRTGPLRWATPTSTPGR